MNKTKMKRFYFQNEDDERCYPLSHFKEDDIIHLAIPDKNDDYFWCRAVKEVGINRASTYNISICGNICPDYDPKNGKSGMCRHKGFCYTSSKEKFIKKGNRSLKIKEVVI